MSKRWFAAVIRRAFIPVAPSLLICLLAGCSQSDDADVWYNKTIVENLGGHTAPSTAAPGQAALPASPTYASAAPAGAYPSAAGVAPPGGPIAAAGPAPPNELYWSETSCGALPPPPPSAAGYAAPTDIALQMTECDVARRNGRPDKVDLSTAPDGLRALTLSYLLGPQPRVYHFVAGHLTSIEYLSPPPPSAKRRPRRAHAT